MSSLKKNIFLIFIFISGFTFSQEKDFEIWTGAAVKSNFLKILEISVEEQLRFNNNATQISKYFTDIGLSYDITKSIEISGFYRYIRFRQLDGNYNSRHRFYTDLSFKKDIRRFQLTFRSRYQARYVDIVYRDLGYLQKNYSRNKVSIQYFHRKYPINFVISNEWYYQINRYEGSKFDKYRIGFGVDYVINPNKNIKVSYTIQREINVANPLYSYILELGYAYRF